MQRCAQVEDKAYAARYRETRWHGTREGGCFRCIGTHNLPARADQRHIIARDCCSHISSCPLLPRGSSPRDIPRFIAKGRGLPEPRQLCMPLGRNLITNRKNDRQRGIRLDFSLNCTAPSLVHESWYSRPRFKDAHRSFFSASLTRGIAFKIPGIPPRLHLRGTTLLKFLCVFIAGS